MDEKNEYAGAEPDNGDGITEELPVQPDTDLTEPLPTPEGGEGEPDTETWPDPPQDDADETAAASSWGWARPPRSRRCWAWAPGR